MAKAFNSLGALGREMLENAVILLVEDREDDVLIIARAFAEAKLDNEVRVVSDGETAIQYLKGEGPSPTNSAPIPSWSNPTTSRTSLPWRNCCETIGYSATGRPKSNPPLHPSPAKRIFHARFFFLDPSLSAIALAANDRSMPNAEGPPACAFCLF